MLDYQSDSQANFILVGIKEDFVFLYSSGASINALAENSSVMHWAAEVVR